MPAKAALTSRNNPALREAKPAGVSDRVGTLLELVALVVFIGGIALVVMALSGS